MKIQTVYLYNEITNEFTGKFDAQESPLEPGVFITPVHSTKLAPPTISDNQVAVFSNGVWKLVEDYRGQVWYDTTTGAKVTVNFIGKLPDNLAAEEPEVIVKAREHVELVNSASVALSKSDVTVIRCAEDGVVVPALWIAYRKELRAIVNGTDVVSTALPTAPAYLS